MIVITKIEYIEVSGNSALLGKMRDCAGDERIIDVDPLGEVGMECEEVVAKRYDGMIGGEYIWEHIGVISAAKDSFRVVERFLDSSTDGLRVLSVYESAVKKLTRENNELRECISDRDGVEFKESVGESRKPMPCSVPKCIELKLREAIRLIHNEDDYYGGMDIVAGLAGLSVDKIETKPTAFADIIEQNSAIDGAAKAVDGEGVSNEE